jgi:predicted nucleic acid-binding protein
MAVLYIHTMSLTVLDAGVLIGFLDSHDDHHLSARRELAGAVDSDARLALPASSYAEVLEGPGKQGGVDVELVDQVIESMPIEVVPGDSETEQRADDLCAEHDALEMSDALVIATAAVIGAELVLTTRSGWPTREVLDVGPEIRVV